MHKFGRVGLWMCVQYAKGVRVWLCVFKRGRLQLCGGDLRTICPGSKAGRERGHIHPQMTRKTRAGPCPERARAILMFMSICVCLCVCVCVCIRCRYCFTPSTMLYLWYRRSFPVTDAARGAPRSIQWTYFLAACCFSVLFFRSICPRLPLSCSCLTPVPLQCITKRQAVEKDEKKYIQQNKAVDDISKASQTCFPEYKAGVVVALQVV